MARRLHSEITDLYVIDDASEKTGLYLLIDVYLREFTAELIHLTRKHRIARHVKFTQAKGMIFIFQGLEKRYQAFTAARANPVDSLRYE
ncbi:MAG: hypothetical protein KGY60_11330 [Bacteroidales bacterium]|nr:hypothetical protein [Bacteroidales bacterium]